MLRSRGEKGYCWMDFADIYASLSVVSTNESVTLKHLIIVKRDHEFSIV